MKISEIRKLYKNCEIQPTEVIEEICRFAVKALKSVPEEKCKLLMEKYRAKIVKVSELRTERVKVSFILDNADTIDFYCSEDYNIRNALDLYWNEYFNAYVYSIYFDFLYQ